MEVWEAYIALVLVFLVGVGVTLAAMSGEYKQGQIDALTGNIKYELVTNQDRSMSWEKIKGE